MGDRKKQIATLRRRRKRVIRQVKNPVEDLVDEQQSAYEAWLREIDKEIIELGGQVKPHIYGHPPEKAAAFFGCSIEAARAITTYPMTKHKKEYEDGFFDDE